MRLVITLLLCAFAASGQSTEATISGIVTDAHGAVVPNVSVTAVQTETGVKTAVRTNDTGFFSIAPLAIGFYTLPAETTGFRRHTEQRIVLTTGQTLELNIRLEVGAVNESVTVEAT